MGHSLNVGQELEERTASPGRPLMRWAGGKRRLLEHLLALVPQKFGRYFEPFLGGGAVYFALKPECATLSDKNDELIECYKAVKEDPEGVITELRKLKNSEESYYRVRDMVPASGTRKAARFLYLTTLSFNGIYRQNLLGQFNVPYSGKHHVVPADVLPIRETSDALRNATLLHVDFQEAIMGARRGDVVYFDPPYTVAHGNNGFIKYNAKIFSWEDQERLAKVAERLADRGCTVIVSNADHPSILSLYPTFELHRVERSSVIAASSTFRKLTTECIFARGHARHS